MEGTRNGIMLVLIFAVVLMGIVSFSISWRLKSSTKEVICNNNNNNKTLRPNFQEIDTDVESASASLWWIKNPPVYSDKETWLRGWFPEKTLMNGKLSAKNKENSFFWYCFNKYYKKRWVKDIELAQYDLYKWLLVEPAVELNRSCTPPPLIEPSKLQCKAQQPWGGFSGKIRKKPRKLGVAFKYGYETDILELHLMEVYDVVDKIFLVESTRAHIKNNPKLLFWEHLKWTPRFRRFQDKIVHLVLDDLSTVPKNVVGGSLETYQEIMRFNLVVEWNIKNKFFDDDDLISFGDADEIVSRNTLHALKYCELVNESRSVDAAIWFVHQSIQATQISYAFIANISRYSLGSPTFHSFGKCNKTYHEGNWLTREKGRKGGSAVAGGIHLSWYPNPFQLLMKRITCSECRFIGDVSWNYTSLEQFSNWVLFSKPWKTFWLKNAKEEVRGSGDRSEYYPWAMVCNPYRYRSSVFLTNDERLFYTKEQLPFDNC